MPVEQFENALTELFAVAERTAQHITDHLTEEYKEEQYKVLEDLRASLRRTKFWRENLLMPQEQVALDALCEAWEEYLKIPAPVAMEKDDEFRADFWARHEFMEAIHQAQRIILTRCAKRVLGI